MIKSESSPGVGAASPYSTGGGGSVLEHRYGALILCHLLTGDPVPELGDDATVVRVAFQARAESVIDDLLIEGRGGDDAERWAAVAVRRAPRLVRSDDSSVELLASFLSEFIDHWADVQAGQWCLVLASKATNPVQQLGELAAIARTPPDESAFREAVAQRGRTTRAVRSRLVSLDEVVKGAAQRVEVGGVPPSGLTWRFLSSLTIRELRLQAPYESDRTTAVGRLRPCSGTCRVGKGLEEEHQGGSVGLFTPGISLGSGIAAPGFADFPCPGVLGEGKGLVPVAERPLPVTVGRLLRYPPDVVLTVRPVDQGLACGPVHVDSVGHGACGEDRADRTGEANAESSDEFTHHGCTRRGSVKTPRLATRLRVPLRRQRSPRT